MRIDLHQLILALSDTIDLVGVDEILHGKRVACMALGCGMELDLGQEEMELLFNSALLHDCGVSSTKVHKRLVNEMQWDGADQHCRLGAERMERLPHFASMAPIIRYHHTPWSELQESRLDTRTKRYTNLIYLLDRVDALICQIEAPNRLACAESIRQRLEVFRGDYFDPELLDLFNEASRHEVFWIGQEACHLHGRLTSLLPKSTTTHLEGEELLQAASLFADIVDAKSPFTAEHSKGVARLSRYLGELLDLDGPILYEVEVAGLLHDLGKLQVPDSVLGLRGPLDREGLAIMRHHSYVTYRILKKVQGMEQIAGWAANHHEKLDGTGYPFGRNASQLETEDRIIMVADIFQALAQKRPYRDALDRRTVLTFLEKGAANHKLDREIVSMVADNLDTCYQVATAEP